MNIKIEDANYRTVMFGEIQSYHLTQDAATIKAKQLSKENNTAVFIEGWSVADAIDVRVNK